MEDEVKRKKPLSLLRIKWVMGIVFGMAVLIFAFLMHKEIMAGISNLLGH